jgi:predicted outer membrane repeat protein
LSINLSAHTRIEAVFNRVVTVSDFGDGAGSAAAPTLRYALTNARDGDLVTFAGATAGTTRIELTEVLPQITTSMIIEGKGVTLTRHPSWTASSETSQLLYINSATAVVTIRAVHFTGGLSTGNGGAIRTIGSLTLESCVFSLNTAWNGGAIYSTGTLSIRGCTFYSNSGRGGAVYFSASGKLLTLTGNLFYGNTGASSMVYRSTGTTIVASYNVADTAFGTGTGQAGWAAQTGDRTLTSLGIDSENAPFDTTTFVPVSDLQNVLPSTAPADFPATDFYGTTWTFPGAPGAVAAAPSP